MMAGPGIPWLSSAWPSRSCARAFVARLSAAVSAAGRPGTMSGASPAVSAGAARRGRGGAGCAGAPSRDGSSACAAPYSTKSTVSTMKSSPRRPSPRGDVVTGSRSRFGRLLAAERGLALLHIRRKAFLRVVALEQLLLELALDRERRLERDLRAGLDRALDATDRLGGAMRRTEALGVLLDLLDELVGGGRLPDLVDDPELEPPLEVEGLAGHHQLDRRALVDEAREPLRAAGPRQDAERDFRQPDLAGALARDPDVGGHRDLESPAHGVAVQRRDHQLGSVLEAVEGLVGVEAEVVLERRIHGLEHVDVRAGAEKLLPRPPDHEHVDALLEARLEDGVVEIAHHLVGVGVGRWIRELESGDTVLDAVIDELGLGGFHVSRSPSGGEGGAPRTYAGRGVASGGERRDYRNPIRRASTRSERRRMGNPARPVAPARRSEQRGAAASRRGGNGPALGTPCRRNKKRIDERRLSSYIDDIRSLEAPWRDRLPAPSPDPRTAGPGRVCARAISRFPGWRRRWRIRRESPSSGC